MRKTLSIIVCLLGLAVAASAQPKALGIRVGNSVDISYEHIINGFDFIELEAGLEGYYSNNYHVDGVYNLMVAQPDWTSEGSWGFYAGPGAGIALIGNSESRSVYAGFFGNVGLEYTFESLPLQLSIDARPRLMFGNGGMYRDNMFTFGLGVRYSF